MMLPAYGSQIHGNLMLAWVNRVYERRRFLS